MATVNKCDSCGALDSPQNQVSGNTNQTGTSLTGRGISIDIEFPHKYRYKALCDRCIHELVSARFADVCGLIAQYQPARVAGYIQSQPVEDKSLVDDKPLTKAERQALSVLSKRLLGAG